MTTHTQQFDDDWPQVLQHMSVYLHETLPTAGDSPRVSLALSKKLAPENQTRPHLDDWLREWQGQGIVIVKTFVNAEQHTLQINAKGGGGFWRGLAEAIGLSVKEDAVGQRGGGVGGGPAPKHGGAAVGVGVYRPLEEALGNRIGVFLRDELAADQSNMPAHYAYVLTAVELNPLTQAAEALLVKLFDKPPVMRQTLLKKQLDRQLRHYPGIKLLVDPQCHLVKMEPDYLSPNELDEAADHTGRNEFMVFLRGGWQEQAAPQPEPQPVTPLRPSNPEVGGGLRFEIFDRAGQPRVVALASSTIVIGRDPDLTGREVAAPLRVEGQFASRRHCELQVSDSGCTLTDYSSHGTFLDGKPLPPQTPQPVAGLLDIRLGSSGDNSSYADFPRLRVQLPTPTAPAQATPVIVKPTPATPILSPVAAGPVLAQLHIQGGGSGKRMIAIRKLPFTIGRSSNCDAEIEAVNAGVSGQHLTILAIADNGATVDNHGTNGSALAGVPIAKGNHLWPWETPMELAIAAKSSFPTPILLLKRPG